MVVPDAEALAETAATLVRDRVRANPELVMAVPAGRTPRRMYERLRDLQAEAPVEFSRMRVLCVDELCPPAAADGYFWSQVRREFLSWAAVKPEHCHPFRVDVADLDAMCRDYEETIARLGGLDLVMLGLGPNARLATIARAREVVVIVSGAGKRQALRRLTDGPVGPDVPASVLRSHACCTVLADRDATG